MIKSGSHSGKQVYIFYAFVKIVYKMTPCLFKEMKIKNENRIRKYGNFYFL